jgi:hypothetical protein
VSMPVLQSGFADDVPRNRAASNFHDNTYKRVRDRVVGDQASVCFYSIATAKLHGVMMKNHCACTGPRTWAPDDYSAQTVASNM